MRDLRNIFLPFSGLYPLKSLLNSSGQPLIFPFYHGVSDNPPAHLRNLYRVKSKAEFIKDIDLLLKNFIAVSPEILMKENGVEAIDKPSFILSFDDGLREVKEVIAPVLKQKGVPAMFFLNNNFIGNKGLFYRYKISVLLDYWHHNLIKPKEKDMLSEFLKTKISNYRSIKKALFKLNIDDNDFIDRLAWIFNIDFHSYLKENKPYLDENEVNALKDQGFFIGAHSFDHLDFSKLSAENQLTELLESTSEIRNRFKLDYSMFAFPFSDMGLGKDSLEKIHKLENSINASFGTAGLKKGLSIPHYQRIAMEKSSADALRIVKTEYFYYFLKSLVNKN